MELKNREALAEEIGNQVLSDADNLRLFMPSFAATFPFVWCGETYLVTVEMTDGQDSQT